jgi:aminoglycoside 6'-N-acetyltransferase
MLALRRATPADLAVLRAWDEQPHVRAASGADPGWDWEDDLGREVAWREPLIAELDGRPVGFVEIIDPAEEETHYWGEAEPGLRAIDIWIGDEDDLGQGLGAEMMLQALARCFAGPQVSAVVIDPLASNTRACRFYERLGFRLIEPRRFGDDDCLVYRLDRDDWEAAQRI